MPKFAKLWFALRADRRAVTALEYGLIAGMIIAVIGVGFAVLADDLSQQFANVGQTGTQSSLIRPP